VCWILLCGYIFADIAHISTLYDPSRVGGMVEKRGAPEFPDRRQYRHPSRPQPHHQRGASVRLGQLHVSGQQHCGKKTQRHSLCDSLRYAIPLLAAVITCSNTLFYYSVCYKNVYMALQIDLFGFLHSYTQVFKKPILVFLPKSYVSYLFQ